MLEKIKNLSIKKTIILYMAVSLTAGFLLSAVIVSAATVTQQQIWWKYVDQEAYYDAVGKRNHYLDVTIPRVNRQEMYSMDAHLSEFCDFLQTYTVLLLSILGSCIAVALFYRNKLKVPIRELAQASQRIAEDTLEFRIDYENRDELGQLCKEFEKMRAQLAENNRILWRVVEDEKALRAAIAHDIRSPLAVLKGYQEMLLEFVPDPDFDREKITEMLQAGMCQIERLNHFIETMRKMTKLEARPLAPEETTTAALQQRIGDEAAILCKDSGKACAVVLQGDNRTIRTDTQIVLEVVENLLLNALRYAEAKTTIVLSANENELTVTVLDDGCGFEESTDTVTQAFYHANPKDTLQHFGLGMYISRIYCERHGGRLLTGNRPQGGAVVTAVFGLREE